MSVSSEHEAHPHAGSTAWDRLLAVFELGLPPAAMPPDAMRRVRILSIATLAMIGVGFAFMLNFWLLGIPEMYMALTFTIVAAIANLWFLRVRRDANLAAHVAIGLLAVMLVFANYVTGGFYHPNLSWLYVLPMCAAIVLSMRGAALWTGVTIALTFGFWLLPELGVHLESRIPEHLRPAQALFDRVSAIVAIGLIGASFVAGQRRAERELARANAELSRESAYVQLLQHAAVAANEATSLEQAMRDGVARICETMGFEVGHVSLVADDGEIVSSGFAYNGDQPPFAELSRMTTMARYSSGQGLPGRAAESGRTQCVYDLERADGLGPRSQVARDAGLRSGFAVPVRVNDETRAVLEFASTKPLPADERLREVFDHIGEQLGRVEERTALQDRLRQSQKMEAVGQLAAGLAHEINNPMSYARSNLQLLRDEWDALRAKLGDGSSGDGGAEAMNEFEELIDDSLEGVERTIAIVSDVREFSRFGGGGAATWSTADVADLVESAIRVVSPQSPPDVRFERHYGEAPEVVGSRNQLRQVFVNLVVNAVQAVDGAGTVRVATGREGGQVFVRIEDDGKGMSEETQRRLFDPFYTTKPPGEGTGLGLYVTYEIVRSHGGEIDVQSEPGEGSVFEVRLPMDALPEDSGPVPL